MTPELEILSHEQRDEMMKKCCKKLSKTLGPYAQFTLIATFTDPDETGPSHRVIETWGSLSDVGVIYALSQSLAAQTKKTFLKLLDNKD